ncbi:MAG: hypothetical protein LBE08_12035 [Bifidobacteriaceae bacterium]|nr:hypothetical protein [Bifidobacteriaceae bacterium]
MAGFLLGLTVAFGGALLLAGGSELQSRAVYTAGRGWRAFVTSPQWLLGMALLATAVCTNFIALALAPIGAVQSMSIAGLAASATFSALTGRVEATRVARLSIMACLVGLAGFIAVIAANRGPDPRSALDHQLGAVVAVQLSCATVGLVMALWVQSRTNRTARLAGLIVGSIGFGAITAVLKVLVGLVLRDGLAETLMRPGPLVAIFGAAAGAVISGSHIQMAHRVLPAPSVVAGLTITDTITAAALGTLVLQESVLTPLPAVLLVASGCLAFAGVIGLRNLRRTAKASGTARASGTANAANAANAAEAAEMAKAAETAETAKAAGTPGQESTNHACSVF